MSRRTLFILMSVLFVVPTIALAAGLVPCGGTGEPACQGCYFVTLMNNIFKWLVGILSIVFAIIIVWAGLRMVTSVGNVSEKTAAKSMITNAAIGYVIVLGAWLLIDFGMKSLMSPQPASVGPWNTIACVAQPQSRTVGSGSTPPALCADDGFGGFTDCDAELENCTNRGGTSNINTTDPANFYVDCAFTASNSGNVINPDGTAACDPALVGKYFPQDVADAQCIVSHESGCGGSGLSVTDVMGDGNSFSVGAMQINLTWHTLQGCGPGGSNLDCPSAFTGRNYTAVITNRALYDQCVTAALDVDCNLNNGRIIRDNRGNWSDWSTARGCGL